MAAGSHGFIVGGHVSDGLTGGAARTNLAPQAPFFQLGLLGATVPGLKLDGEIGQQIGYLNAATVGAVNFILLIIVGWGFAHKERVRELVGNCPPPPGGQARQRGLAGQLALAGLDRAAPHGQAHPLPRGDAAGHVADVGPAGRQQLARDRGRAAPGRRTARGSAGRAGPPRCAPRAGTSG